MCLWAIGDFSRFEETHTHEPPLDSVSHIGWTVNRYKNPIKSNLPMDAGQKRKQIRRMPQILYLPAVKSIYCRRMPWRAPQCTDLVWGSVTGSGTIPSSSMYQQLVVGYKWLKSWMYLSMCGMSIDGVAEVFFRLYLVMVFCIKTCVRCCVLDAKLSATMGQRIAEDFSVGFYGGLSLGWWFLLRDLSRFRVLFSSEIGLRFFQIEIINFNVEGV